MAGQVVIELTAQDKISGVLSRVQAASVKLNQAFQQTTKRVGDRFGKLKERIANSFEGIQDQVVNLQSALGSIAIGVIAKGLVDAGVQADRTASRLKFLGDQFGETAKLQQFASEAAEKFTLGQTEAANAVADLFGRLRPAGTSLDDIKTVFNGLNVAAKQMGLSVADTEGVMLQLNQALGVGKLQGNDFKSIMQRLPKIGQAVAKAMGVTVGELQNLSTQGKITNDVIIKALKGIEKQGFPEADGVAKFNKAMADLSTTIGQKLTPILDPILKGIAGLVNFFLDLPEPVKAAAIAFTAVGAAFAAIAPLLPILAAGISAVVAVLTGPVGIVAGIAAVVAAFAAMRGKAEETEEPVAEVASEADKIKAAVEAAAKAKQQFIDKTKQHIIALEQELSKIQQAEQAYENTIKITDARLNAEQEINSLQNQTLERAYEQAGSDRERLNIAKQIYENEINGAKIAYQQTLNSIEAERQRLEFRRQAAAIEAKMIQAKGELAAAEAAAQANGAEKAQLILDKTQKAVQAQRENISVLEGQISAQNQIAQHQITAAQAVFKQKQLTAQSKAEQKGLRTNLAKSNTTSEQLATSTGQVSNNALNAANNFIRVASEADMAAVSIANAATQQRQLNSAISQSFNSAGTTTIFAQAQGGYNSGSFKAFAQGGVVKGPTLGLIGEGGEPEYIIPQSKAAGFAANFLAGKRGAGAIPGFAEGGMAVPSTANVSIQTGPVTQMDGQNFVTTAEMGAAVEAGIMQTLDMIQRDHLLRTTIGLS